MSITERIIEIIEDARARSASDQKIDEALFRTGCTRIVRRLETMIVYYDEDPSKMLSAAFSPRR